MNIPQGLIPFTGLAFLLIFLYSIYSGYRNGFVLKVLELLSTLVSVILAWSVSGALGKQIHLISVKEIIGIPVIDAMLSTLANQLVVFLVLFLLLRIVVRLLKPAFKTINWIPLVGFVNRLAGALIGALQGILMIGLLLFLLSTPLFANGKEVIAQSGLYEAKKMMHSFFQDTFLQMESLQKLSANEIMQEEDYEHIINWMNKQGFSAKEQMEILVILKDRDA